MASTETMTDNN